MRHCDYDNSVTLMAEEAVQLGINRPINKNVLAMLEGMNEEYLSRFRDEFKTYPEFYTIIFYFSVWNAGRIEGIRAERKRRKQAVQTNQ